ncbi:hypothetical protein HPS54_11125 [Prevotella sp. PCHR]|uniref:Lipoprotein n=1 Tax=Xylanibacter caecicola TaxID=2736294 RepID=A0ABX2B3J9_9BACT|nr:hypothetical protein [Xylanibacter caecicola]NPE26052.1 hypothetical protein [Xylanibacter caecicola]
MKKHYYLMTAAVACVFMTGCKDGGPSASGPLGELPRIVKEHEGKLEEARHELAKVKDAAEMQALFVKGSAIQEEMKAQIKSRKEELIGKDIEGEVTGDVPVKIVSPFKIKSITDKGNIEVVAEVELTDTGTYLRDNSAFDLSNIRVIAIGGNENEVYVHNGSGFRTDGLPYSDKYAQGTKGFVTTYLHIEPWNADMMGGLSKLVIVNKNSDRYRAARETGKKAKEEYESKLK